MWSRRLLQCGLLVALAQMPWMANAVAEPAPLVPVAVEPPAATTPSQPLAPPSQNQNVPGTFEAHVELANLLVHRSDSDFDGSAPKYNASGQSIGAVATVLKPKLSWRLGTDLHIYWESEVGLNYWSKNNPDQENPTAPDYFVVKQREIFAEGRAANGQLGYKVGYQYFSDPTALFLGHWIGLAQARTTVGLSGTATLFAGQMPDQTYEGLNITQNSFRRDSYVFGGRFDTELTPTLTLHAGLTDLYDTSVVGQTRWVASPSMRLELHGAKMSGFLDAIVQYGASQGSGQAGIDQTILAWAAQGHLQVPVGAVDLALNAMALSADDAHEGNNRSGGFLYSSKSSSATVVLTEDEHRNWYDQLDRRMARYQGGFWTHRAGLMVADAKATWRMSETFRPALIAGVSTVLNPDNALGNRLVGVEGAIDLGWHASEALAAHLLGGVLVPGGAAAALTNTMNLAAKEPIYTVEAALKTRF